MRITTLFILVICSSLLMAQAPQSFKYQAVVRNASGEVLSDQNIALRLSIIKEHADGRTVYSEIHRVHTSMLGLVNLNIGMGETPSSRFADIDWGSANHYVRIELDPTGTGNYLDMGTTQLLSVPYALYAQSAGNGNGRGGGNLWEEDKVTGSIYNDNDGNVGVGTETPDETLHVSGSFKLEDGNEGAGKILSSDASGKASWSDPGTVFSETDPVFSLSTASGISAPDVTNWNSAYGWGDHAAFGYLTSESDPLFSASASSGILGSDITNWNDAFGWGNHASVGYLTLETDPLFSASPSAGISLAKISDWNAAYSWGDHAAFGYLTSESDPLFSASASSGILGSDITNWNTAFGWGNHANAGYLTLETDPLFSASPSAGISMPNIADWNAAYSWGNHATFGYLTSESDPLFSASASSGILGSDITNWNDAFGWGNHASAGYLTLETDPLFSASPSAGISLANISDWNLAYGWGDHATFGYLTSESDPLFSASASSGILGFDITNWNDAFGWGNHAGAGYLTLETDPLFSASPSAGISLANISDWNAAYGWGDHAMFGYLTSESDPLFSASASSGILGSDISNWNTAFGWGNHASAGYLTSETDPLFTASPSAGILNTDITNWNTAVSWGDHNAAGYDGTQDAWTGNGDTYTTSGNVGIGTDSPDESLHTTGKVKIEGMTAGNILDSLVTWNPADSTLRVIPASSIGGGSGIGIVPDPSIPVPIAFQGDTLWVHPTDNAASVDWTTAISTCETLSAYGKNDWYAPSRLELDAIYKQSYFLTGLEQYNDWKYWSSTEKDTDNAFTQRMDYGGPDPDPKTDVTNHRVRCVRKN